MRGVEKKCPSEQAAAAVRGAYRLAYEYSFTAKFTKMALPSRVASTMGPNLSSSAIKRRQETMRTCAI